jgi:hypothetical protein
LVQEVNISRRSIHSSCRTSSVKMRSQPSSGLHHAGVADVLCDVRIDHIALIGVATFISSSFGWITFLIRRGQIPAKFCAFSCRLPMQMNRLTVPFLQGKQKTTRQISEHDTHFDLDATEHVRSGPCEPWSFADRTDVQLSIVQFL